MKTAFVYSMAFLLSALCSNGLAATATPTVYKMTMKKVEASSNGGTSYITIGEGDQTINVASVSAGAKAADYIKAVSLPDGFYNRMRVTISNVFTLQGNLTQDAGLNNGVNFCTDDDGTPSSGACTPEEQNFSITSDTGFPAGMTLDVGAGTITVIDTGNSFTIDSTTSKKFRIAFDVANSLVIEANDTMHPGGITVTISEV